MALNPDAFVREGILDYMRSTVEGGTLEILSAAAQVIAIFQLDVSAGAVDGTDWLPDYVSATVSGEEAAGEGTQGAAARIKNGGGTVRFIGLTVGVGDLETGSADVRLNNIWISEGQNVTLTFSRIRYPGA